MANPLRGEVWLVDLGMVAKIRPCLVFCVPAAGPNDRVLVTVVAHTTSTGMALPLGVSRRLIQRLVLPATQSAEHGATRPPRSGVHHRR